MEDNILENFIKKNEERRNRIDQIKGALSSTSFEERTAVMETNHGNKEISSIFDGNKTVYRASTDDKNVFYFTNPKLIQSYLER